MVLTHSEDHDSELKTTLAASIRKVLKGDDHIIREFDELRSILKDAKKNKGRNNNLKEKVERYNTLAAKLSLQVLARRTKLDEAVKEFEHQYFLKHSGLPKRDVPSYTKLITQKKPCKGCATNTQYQSLTITNYTINCILVISYLQTYRTVSRLVMSLSLCLGVPIVCTFCG